MQNLVHCIQNIMFVHCLSPPRSAAVSFLRSRALKVCRYMRLVRNCLFDMHGIADMRACFSAQQGSFLLHTPEHLQSSEGSSL